MGNRVKPSQQDSNHQAADPTTDFAFGANGEAEATPANKSEPPKPAREPDVQAIRGLRKVGGFSAQSKVKTEQLAIVATKPKPAWWVMVHPDPDFTQEAYVIDLGDRKKGTYLLAGDDLHEQLMGERVLKMKLLAAAINRQGTLFLWEGACPWEGDLGGKWTETSVAAMEAAREGWVRVISGEDGYNLGRPNGVLPDPVWPERSFESIVQAAYSGRIITDIDDKILRELRGEA